MNVKALGSQLFYTTDHRADSHVCSVVVFAQYLVEIVVRLQDDAVGYSSEVFPFAIGHARPWNIPLEILD